MIVSASTPLGDTVCPHCGAGVYVHWKRTTIDSDDEKKLADMESSLKRTIVEKLSRFV